MIEQQTTIRLTISPNLRDAVSTVMQVQEPLEIPVVIATANDNSAEPESVAQIVRRCLIDSLSLSPRAESRDDKEVGAEVRIVAPPALARLTWQRVRHRRDPSVEVDLRGRGGQLSSVRIAREIATAETVIAVNDVRGEANVRSTIVLGIWWRYTDLRDRMGLRLSAADKGAAAEIALAVQPRLIVLVYQWRGYLVALASSDQIAAELAGLAIKQVIKGDAEEPIGPWEDPLVQRATELHLGVLLPDQIAIRGMVTNGADSASRETVSLLSEQIALKLGVANVPALSFQPSAVRMLLPVCPSVRLPLCPSPKADG